MPERKRFFSLMSSLIIKVMGMSRRGSGNHEVHGVRGEESHYMTSPIKLKTYISNLQPG